MGVKDLASLRSSADRLLGRPGKVAAQIATKLQIYSIWGIDQKSQNFKMNYRLYFHWKDCRLLYGCDTWIRVADTSKYFESFWRPRLFIPQQEDVNADLSSKIHHIYGSGVDIYEELQVGTFRCKIIYLLIPRPLH